MKEPWWYEWLYYASLAPVVAGGLGVCVWLDPPWWLGSGGILVAAAAWHVLVVRRLPPFRGRDVL